MACRRLLLVLVLGLVLIPSPGCLYTATKTVVGGTRLAVRTTAKATVATVQTTAKAARVGAKVVTAPVRWALKPDETPEAELARSTRVDGAYSVDSPAEDGTKVAVSSSGVLEE